MALFSWLKINMYIRYMCKWHNESAHIQFDSGMGRQEVMKVHYFLREIKYVRGHGML